MLYGSLSFYCLLIAILLFILNLPLSSFLLKIRESIHIATDSRINIINKLIMGIQTVKSYAWEQALKNKAIEARAIEARRLKKHFCLFGCGDGFFRYSNILFSFPLVLVPLFQGLRIDASYIFVALSLTEYLAVSGIMMIGQSSRVVGDYLSAFSRI